MKTLSQAITFALLAAFSINTQAKELRFLTEYPVLHQSTLTLRWVLVDENNELYEPGGVREFIERFFFAFIPPSIKGDGPHGFKKAVKEEYDFGSPHLSADRHQYFIQLTNGQPAYILNTYSTRNLVAAIIPESSLFNVVLLGEEHISAKEVACPKPLKLGDAYFSRTKFDRETVLKALSLMEEGIDEAEVKFETKLGSKEPEFYDLDKEMGSSQLRLRACLDNGNMVLAKNARTMLLNERYVYHLSEYQLQDIQESGSFASIREFSSDGKLRTAKYLELRQRSAPRVRH